MNKDKIDISIIIVNYKVKEYISNLITSISKAKEDLNLEIFVVDNNSEDDSIKFLKSRFPNLIYIENKENLGFGVANNQAINKAKGKYSLIINPDTLVSEDTFVKLIQHMDSHPNCGAAGCKILNPDGTFAPESRRSVPTIWSSFVKVTGLGKLFPNIRLFNQYYMSWLDENKGTQVPVLSGSFMFWRTELLKKLEGFDERFFMYGEDIDLCYRIQNTKYHIDYVPETSIIHYKGESTRKGDIKYIKIFNRALYQFFEKHHSSKYSLLFKTSVFTAIRLKTILAIIAANVRSVGFIASDLILLNISVILGFLIRYEFTYEVFTNIQNLKFLWINLLASIIYVFTGGFLDLFKSQKDSISSQIKAIGFSYAGVAFITFFVRDYAFSRLALIIGCIIALVLMVLFKIIQINASKTDIKVTGKIKRIRILLVGDQEYAKEITSKIHSRPDWNYEVIGTIHVDEETPESLGGLPQLKDFVKAYHIDQVFFVLKSISYTNMLRQISILQGEQILFKLIPDSMDFILGKSNVEYMESIPLIDVDLAYSKGANQFIKRLMDISISVPLLAALSLVTFPSLFINKRKTVKGVSFFEKPLMNKWKNRWVLFWLVFTGRFSLVGSPISEKEEFNSYQKKGLTGLIQINETKVQSNSEKENYDLYYLKNYSIWIDVDILLKSFFNSVSPLRELDKLDKDNS